MRFGSNQNNKEDEATASASTTSHTSFSDEEQPEITFFLRDASAGSVPAENADGGGDAGVEVGDLGLDKVYELMESVRREQKRSAALFTALQEQQKTSTVLKREVIALCCLAVLLAISNIGTSFAAATLAKDTVVDSQTTELVIKGTNERVSTTSRLVEVEMQAPDGYETKYNTDLVAKVSIIEDGDIDEEGIVNDGPSRKLAAMCQKMSRNNLGASRCTVQGKCLLES